MPYITSVERIGMEKGLQQGMEKGMEKGMQQMVLDALDERFGETARHRFGGHLSDSRSRPAATFAP